MAKSYDFTGMSLDELDEVIKEATSLRNEKVEVRRAELMAELEKLGGAPSKPRLPAALNGDGRKRNSPRVAFRGPNGEEYTNRGPLPKWAKELGITDKAGLEPYRVRD